MVTSSKTFKTLPEGKGKRVAIVVARFHEAIAEQLLTGAKQALVESHVSEQDIEVFSVAGAFELPLVLQALANCEYYHAAVALGAVIRGETPHFDYVAGEAARGIREVMLKTGLPIGFGVLTTDTEAQAASRAGGAHGNKGFEAARAALEVTQLLEKIEKKR